MIYIYTHTLGIIRVQACVCVRASVLERGIRHRSERKRGTLPRARDADERVARAAGRDGPNFPPGCQGWRRRGA